MPLSFQYFVLVAPRCFSVGNHEGFLVAFPNPTLFSCGDLLACRPPFSKVPNGLLLILLEKMEQGSTCLFWP